MIKQRMAEAKGRFEQAQRRRRWASAAFWLGEHQRLMLRWIESI